MTNGTLTEIVFNSCTAQIFYDGLVCSIQSIHSEKQGNGDGVGCINKIEEFAKSNGIPEVWYPTVISPILEHILEKRGYSTRYMEHPEMKEMVKIYIKSMK